MGEALDIAATEAERWRGRTPDAFRWQVLIYGGTCPRTGFDQPSQVFQYFKRRHGTGYTLAGVKVEAEHMARWQKRARFAIRDTDGTVVFDGLVRDALGNPLPGADLAMLSKGHRTFERLERRTGSRAAMLATRQNGEDQ